MVINVTSKILDFWFSGISFDDEISNEAMSKWWKKDPAFDLEIKNEFEEILKSALSGEYNDLLKSPRGRLALIILFDQFPRNMYRNIADSFAYDKIALDFATEGVSRELDMQLAPIQRSFFYMPFEHSESLSVQDRSISLYTKLFNESPDKQKNIFEDALDFAIAHKVIIAKFGRFPHRNKILGRESTAEEIEYLKNNYGF